MTRTTPQTHAISLNPFNGERLADYAYDSPQALEAAVSQGSDAFKLWRNVDISDRATHLLQLAAELHIVDGSEDIARMIALKWVNR